MEEYDCNLFFFFFLEIAIEIGEFSSYRMKDVSATVQFSSLITRE